MPCDILSAPRAGTILRLAAAGLLALTLAACSDDEAPVYVERPVEELYNGALNQLYLENYEESARLFDEVERLEIHEVDSTTLDVDVSRP